MRLLLAAVATLAAVAFAAPAFAQETAPAATPTPIAKPKPGTAAYCNTLKSTSSKSACLKRVHAQAATPKAPGGSTATHKKAKKPEAKPADTSAQLTPPAAAPASGSAPSQTINVPPLPQKTI
jgi:hypothetical protein